jgi:hypothetical protein
VGRVLVRPEVLGGAQMAALFIPVYGPAIMLAVEWVRKAETEFGAAQGPQKLAWILEHLPAALEAAGVKEKRIRALVEVALLVVKEEAEIRVEAEP